MIGTIIGNFKKSNASLIVENLLKLQKVELDIKFNAETLSIDLINDLWTKEQTIFKNRYFKWPNKLSLCVAALAYGVENYSYNGKKRQALIGALFVALVEVEDNHSELLGRSLDKHLISFALKVGADKNNKVTDLGLWQEIAPYLDQ